jgi:hypothetical protein
LIRIFAMLCLALGARAYEGPHNIRSPRGLMMGDAWTAVNTDEYTLFYNPASMARHQRDFTFFPFNPMVTGTNVVGDMDKYEEFPETPLGMADLLMNEPLHVGVSMAPGFKLFNFGFNVIASESVDLLMRNRISPTLDVDYRSDRGFVAGVGIPLGSSRLQSKSLSGQQTSIGVAAKYIKRKGLADSFALAGTDMDILVGGGDANEIIDRIGLVEGQSWGFDLGLEHVLRQGTHQFVVGLAALDVTNTDFEIENNPDDKRLSSIRDQVNLGAAWMMRSSLFKGTFSMDVRGLTDEQEFLERFRFGVELGSPILSVLGGWNAGYVSYGAALDVGLLKIVAGFYGVETGGGYQRVESERFVIYLSLFDFSFDA